MARNKHNKKLNKQQNALANEYHYLIKVITPKYTDFDSKTELQGVAEEALCNAAVAYKPDMGANFETFASMYINGALSCHIKKEVLHMYVNDGNKVFADMVSLEMPLDKNHDLRIKDVIGTDYDGSEELIAHDRELVNQCMECLNDAEKEIIMYRFCFYGNEDNIEKLQQTKYRNKSVKWLYRRSQELVDKMAFYAHINNIF